MNAELREIAKSHMELENSIKASRQEQAKIQRENMSLEKRIKKKKADRYQKVTHKSTFHLL